jgi:hypothetical protein
MSKQGLAPAWWVVRKHVMKREAISMLLVATATLACLQEVAAAAPGAIRKDGLGMEFIHIPAGSLMMGSA